MIDFMVIGLPRSGTSWAANWFNTNDIFCLHDPLYRAHYKDWGINSPMFPDPGVFKKVGISCSGIWRFPDWFNKQPGRKLILERPIDEIQNSLTRCGLPRLTQEEVDGYCHIDPGMGMRRSYKDLFNPDTAKYIWQYLIGTEFDEWRHSELVRLNIQPDFAKIDPDPEVTQRLYNELSLM